MTPNEFIQKWRAVDLKERTASQSHFNDICRLLDIEDPITADPKGEWFTFEKGASKTGGSEGWADVWRKECFAWEYKGKKKDLNRAFAQLQQYAIALDNPPLLIVSDMDRFRIHTNWTNTVQEVHEFALDDLLDGATRDLLRNCFLDPERLKPAKTRQMLTEEAAEEFSQLAQRLRARGHEAHAVAHFVNRLVFCMFAEDVRLLPDHMFTAMLKASVGKPDSFATNAAILFGAMKTGGLVGFTKVEWFNGGLFDDDSALPLERADIDNLITAAALDWSEIDPSILGTLFERGLDPDKRSQLGAHYTDRDKIMQIVEPVIIRPLMAEWEAVRAKIEEALAKAEKATGGVKTRAESEAKRLQAEWHERLRNFRVLDPACGSGNFLYLSLLALKDIEHRTNLEAEALSPALAARFPSSGPENVMGIELNPYAAELARVSVWIGEIQWMRRNGFEAAKNPILKPLANIENRDAILKEDGTEADWPDANAIVGNPPFLGAKIMKRSLGVAETESIRAAFAGRLPGFTDLVCYWFEKARAQVSTGISERAGLVATNSIAKNTNLPVLRRIVADCEIYEAWADEPWIVDGAAVRVALICFVADGRHHQQSTLNGQRVNEINADLTSGLDVSSASPLAENASVGFVGVQKSGPFDIPGELARTWLKLPNNPHGRRNAEVLKPTWNGRDITTSRRDIWFIDFPRGLTEAEASLWEAPFGYLKGASYDPDDPASDTLEEVRKGARDHHPRTEWWTTYWPRPDVREALVGLSRYVVTPMTAEHRIFLWQSLPTLPDNNLVIIAKDDDTHFGILHSIFHETWSSRIGNKMGAGNQRRYNRETIYDSFPFPEGLTADIPASDYADDPRAQAIAAAAARLNELRENWLNPPDLVERVPEVVEGYPDRILPKDDAAAKELKKRTLTNLYNARPAWLDHAHRALDEAVAEAYGWGDDFRAGLMTDDEILARLFRLNQKRAEK